ncbi:hypothetical protein N9V90_02800 [Endozoicomonas sp.]|nr:hypothetical protein [Endozoicomonas sp.]
MSDIKLFRLPTDDTQAVTPLSSHLAALEKDLQQLIEAQMEPLLRVRFLANHGRIILISKALTL